MGNTGAMELREWLVKWFWAVWGTPDTPDKIPDTPDRPPDRPPNRPPDTPDRPIPGWASGLVLQCPSLAVRFALTGVWCYLL
jgi:hypothetical protein